MTTQVITTSPDRDITEIARILDEKRIKRLPVVNENNKVIGINLSKNRKYPEYWF